MKVSIVLSAFRRPKQLEFTLQTIAVQAFRPLEVIVVEHGDDGRTQWTAKRAGCQYIQVPRTDLPMFQNPSRVHNMGIKAATGDIVILQGGEVCYTNPMDISNLVTPMFGEPSLVRTPLVASLHQNGTFHEWYVHPEGTRAGWMANFCLAVPRKRLMDIHGFEESFTGYGYEDDFLMFCLRRQGAQFEYAKNVTVHHQWHDRAQYDFGNTGTGIDSPGYAHLRHLVGLVERGERPPVANLDRQWGER